MPTTIFRLVLLVLILVLSPVTANRRILHQPFFPQTSSPPPAPPAPPALPFSGDQDPFFPSYPPPPPSPTPLPPSPFASFPANISSLPLPHSPSSHPLSKKLVAVTVCVSISAVFIASVALFFYFRGRRTRPTDIPTPKAAAPAPPPPPPPPPALRNSVRSNSTEFLYLGTLANSTSTSSGVTRVPGGVRGSSRPRSRRTDSPELHPLPPLTRRQTGGPDDDQEQFYSPRGSVSGRESGSDSRRVFGSVTQTADNNGGNCDGDDTTSYSSSSGSDSPSRSVSISISPPISASPKNRSTISISNPKSSPEFIELNLQPPSSPPYLPESDTSSESEKAVEVEAEESPLLSHASSSSRMNSPPQSPILSPIAGKIGQFSPEKSDWNDLNRSSPVSNSSSWSRKSSFLSLNLPAFLGGGKRKSSPENSPTSPISSLGSSLNAPLPRPPPPPPPPPPAFRRSQSPPRPPPVAPLVSKRDGIVTPLKHVLVEGSRSGESEETTPRPKLKPLHWDKVKASSDREMVWDQLRSSSFKLNEEMIETLFIVKNPTPSKKETPRGLISPMSKQENRVLDPKKAQNIAILLRALHVTMEEVCEALMEGNAETLGTELLESLLKMAPTKEEERKLKEYKDDSPVKLGHAEKFLKAVIDIPFAFKRVEAMLYIANFESEVEYLKKSFNTIEAACDELRSSRMFLKLLEAVLKTGNRMNVGTNRGDAHAFKLDTLLKLVDVKGADGKTTLLHFVVQEIIRTEGQRLSPSNNQSLTDEAKCRKLGLQVVSSLSSELANVKKAAAMDSDVLSNDVSKLTSGLGNIEQVLKLIGEVHSQENNRRFSESMNKFMKMAEEDIFRVQALERVALSLVKEITEYFHGNSAMEEAHPFRIFMVVRDLLTVLDRVCKEVGMINERTTVSSAHRFPVPINPMLPVPVNPFHHQVLPGFPGHRQSSFSDDGSL